MIRYCLFENDNLPLKPSIDWKLRNCSAYRNIEICGISFLFLCCRILYRSLGWGGKNTVVGRPSSSSSSILILLNKRRKKRSITIYSNSFIVQKLQMFSSHFAMFLNCCVNATFSSHCLRGLSSLGVYDESGIITNKQKIKISGAYIIMMKDAAT